MSAVDCETATAQELAAAVVNYIEVHGWGTGDLGTGDGPVCLLGGVAAVCTGDPQKGYGLLGGWVLGLEGKAPASILALGHALEAEATFPEVTADYSGCGGEWERVSDGAITGFNDLSGTVEDALLPFKKIAGRV